MANVDPQRAGAVGAGGYRANWRAKREDFFGPGWRYQLGDSRFGEAAHGLPAYWLDQNRKRPEGWARERRHAECPRIPGPGPRRHESVKRRERLDAGATELQLRPDARGDHQLSFRRL